MALVLLAGSFLLNSVRTMEAIDLTSDESTYAIESVAFSRTGLTMWNGAPFFVHPPLFYMTEAGFYNVLGIGDGPLFDRLMGPHYTAGEPLLGANVPLTGDSMLTAIEYGRYLNSFYGALLTVLVFLLGRSLLNLQLGMLGSVLFALDPYVLWRNHFNYLEPLATIFGVLCIYMYYLAQKQTTRKARLRYLALTGLFFGLAMLSKELAILYIVAIGLHALLFKRVRVVETLIPFGVGAAIYSIFPIWAAASGEFPIWWETKLWIVQRAVGLIADSGLGRPGISLIDTLLINLPDYWPWLLMLGIGLPLAVLFLYLYYRHGFRDVQAELLTACILGMYGFFIAVRLVGGVTNEQYFYLIMPVVALSVGYAVLVAPKVRSWLAAKRQGIPAATASMGTSGNGASSADKVTAPLGQVSTAMPVHGAWAWSKVLAGVLAVMVVYNMFAWVVRYVFSNDNSYMQVEAKVAETLPPGTQVVGRDLLGLYLMPKQAVYTFGYLNLADERAEVAKLTASKIPYAVLNEQSLLQRYGGANPEYYAWVEQNGQPVAEFQGRKYRTTVYELKHDGTGQQPGTTGAP
ncbi:MAG TPA: glycosyltransferase family 39 protein [Chloroflexia bacterium]|jgi:4-amino-4-deoxy-L-arabinose transferase-like glycosyltransferase